MYLYFSGAFISVSRPCGLKECQAVFSHLVVKIDQFNFALTNKVDRKP